MKTVAAIIPIHKYHHYFAQSLTSAIQQTYPLNEIIVVDDGSNDPTIERLVNGFGDPRIKFVKLENNLGLAQARNIGVLTAESDLLAFLDSDDYWAPNKIAMQLPLLEDVGEIIVSGVEFINPDGSRVGYCPNTNDKLLETLFESLFSFLPSSWLISKETFNRLNQFDPNLKFAEDWDFLIRAALDNVKVAMHADVLTFMNVRPESLSNRHKPNSDVEYLLRKILKLRQNDSRITTAMLAKALSSMARWMHLKHSFIFELELIFKAMLVSPTIIKSKEFRGNVMNMMFNR